MTSAAPEDVTPLVVIVLLVLLVGVGWLTSRALGVQRGFGRAVIAGVVGLLVFGALVTWRSTSTLPLGAGTWILLSLVVMTTMVASVILDALLKPRRPGTKRGPLTAARKLRGQAQTWGRMLEIARHARAHRLNVTTLSSPQGASLGLS